MLVQLGRLIWDHNGDLPGSPYLLHSSFGFSQKMLQPEARRPLAYSDTRIPYLAQNVADTCFIWILASVDCVIHGSPHGKSPKGR